MKFFVILALVGFAIAVPFGAVLDAAFSINVVLQVPQPDPSPTSFPHFSLLDPSDGVPAVPAPTSSDDTTLPAPTDFPLPSGYTEDSYPTLSNEFPTPLPTQDPSQPFSTSDFLVPTSEPGFSIPFSDFPVPTEYPLFSIPISDFPLPTRDSEPPFPTGEFPFPTGEPDFPIPTNFPSTYFPVFQTTLTTATKGLYPTDTPRYPDIPGEDDSDDDGDEVGPDWLDWLEDLLGGGQHKSGN